MVTGASSGEFTLWNGLTFNFETILQVNSSIRVSVNYPEVLEQVLGAHLHLLVVDLWSECGSGSIRFFCWFFLLFFILYPVLSLYQTVAIGSPFSASHSVSIWCTNSTSHLGNKV